MKQTEIGLHGLDAWVEEPTPDGWVTRPPRRKRWVSPKIRKPRSPYRRREGERPPSPRPTPALLELEIAATHERRLVWPALGANRDLLRSCMGYGETLTIRSLPGRPVPRRTAGLGEWWFTGPDTDSLVRLADADPPDPLPPCSRCNASAKTHRTDPRYAGKDPMQDVEARVRHITNRDTVRVEQFTREQGFWIKEAPTRKPNRPLLVYRKTSEADDLGGREPKFGATGKPLQPVGAWGEDDNPPLILVCADEQPCYYCGALAPKPHRANCPLKDLLPQRNTPLAHPVAWMRLRIIDKHKSPEVNKYREEFVDLVWDYRAIPLPSQITRPRPLYRTRPFTRWRPPQLGLRGHPDSIKPLGFDNWSARGEDSCAVCLGLKRLIDPFWNSGPRLTKKPTWNPESHHDMDYDWRPTGAEWHTWNEAEARDDEANVDSDPAYSAGLETLHAPGIGPLFTELRTKYERAVTEWEPAEKHGPGIVRCPDCGRERGTTKRDAWRSRGAMLCDRCLAISSSHDSGYAQGKATRLNRRIRGQAAGGLTPTEIALEHGLNEDWVRQKLSKERAPLREGKRVYVMILYSAGLELAEIAKRTGVQLSTVEKVVAAEKTSGRHFVPMPASWNRRARPQPLTLGGDAIVVAIGDWPNRFARFSFPGRRGQRLALRLDVHGPAVSVSVNGPVVRSRPPIIPNRVVMASEQIEVEITHTGSQLLMLAPTGPGHSKIALRLSSAVRVA